MSYLTVSRLTVSRLCMTLFFLLTLPSAFSLHASESEGPAAPDNALILNVAGLYLDPVESHVTQIKDPDPCVPCDGFELNTMSFVSFRIDISDLIPFPRAWELLGIYFVVGDDTYWFSHSADFDILHKYSNAEYTSLVIEDFYGVSGPKGEKGKDISLHFEFNHLGMKKWIKKEIWLD